MLSDSRFKKGLAFTGLAFIAFAFAYHVSNQPMDFRVYHYGARGVFDGTRPVYGLTSGLGWPMHYRYPPLFLLLFAPLAMLPLGLAAAVWVLAKFGILVWLIAALWKRGPKGPLPNAILSKSGPSPSGRGWRNAPGEGGPTKRFAIPALTRPSGTLSRREKDPRLKSYRVEQQPLKPATTYAGTYLVPFLFIAPYLIEEFRYGNAQFFVLALTIGALLILRERPIVAAFCLALAISIKVWPLFFLPYLAVRREWKPVAFTVAFVLLLALLPSLYFGLSGNASLLGQWFVQESNTQLSENEIWFPNQSLRGVLMRYLTVIDYSKVPDSNYALVNVATIDPATVRLLWLILVAGIYAGFLLRSSRRRNSDGWQDHALAFCLLALLEPFTQKYALAVLLWPAMAAVGLMKNSATRTLIYCATVLVLIQPLAQGASAQRLLHVLGLDFAATLLLTIAFIIC